MSLLSPAQVPAFVKFREAHHAIARMFAKGHTVSKVAHETGYSRRRLYMLLDDPTFQELVVHYNNEEEADHDLYGRLQVSARNLAEMLLLERLQASTEEDGEPMSAMALNKISQDRADRTGYSKHTKQTVEHSFSDQLERAIARSNAAKLIDHVPPKLEAQPSTGAVPSPDGPMPVVAELHHSPTLGVVVSGAGASLPPPEARSNVPPSSSAPPPPQRVSLTRVLQKRKF